MSELKAYKGDIYIPVYGSVADAKVYLKSEADKVIAYLEESHKKEVEQLLMEIIKLKHSLELASNECCSISERGVKNARHHKYKRCLAMAKWCDVIHENYELLADDAYRRSCFNLESRWNKASDKWLKRKNKWLAIANKYKEAK